MKARKKATCPVLSCSPPPLILDTDSYPHHPSPPSPYPLQVSNQETESIPIQIPMDQEQPSKVSKKRKAMQRALVTVRVEPEAGRQKGESAPVEIPLGREPTSMVSKKRKVVQRAVVTVRVKGEGPPSDSWSWRKYGQKPIKGSPFPRGYYRCSSLKGCSAKKQVERCRTDASVIIVTYTSNHNHPGPDALTIQSPSEISVPVMNPAAVEVAEGESSIVSFSPAGPNDSCKEDDDFFDELEELPISSSAFTGLGRSSFFDERILLPS